MTHITPPPEGSSNDPLLQAIVDRDQPGTTIEQLLKDVVMHADYHQSLAMEGGMDWDFYRRCNDFYTAHAGRLTYMVHHGFYMAVMSFVDNYKRIGLTKAMEYLSQVDKMNMTAQPIAINEHLHRQSERFNSARIHGRDIDTGPTADELAYRFGFERGCNLVYDCVTSLQNHGQYTASIWGPGTITWEYLGDE